MCNILTNVLVSVYIITVYIVNTYRYLLFSHGDINIINHVKVLVIPMLLSGYKNVTNKLSKIECYQM